LEEVGQKEKPETQEPVEEPCRETNVVSSSTSGVKEAGEESTGESPAEDGRPTNAILVVLLILLLTALVLIGLAWKTEYLGAWLPDCVKEFLGKEYSIPPGGDESWGPGGGEEEEAEEGDSSDLAQGEEEDLSLCGGVESKLESLDGVWNIYYNCALGFSIAVPKEMSSFYGACEWKAAENSYRPKSAPVPVKVYEDNDNGIVYIAAAHYYELAGETVSGGGSCFSECNKVDNSLARLNDEYLSSDRGYYQQAWKIYVKTVSDDVGLEAFIKDRYGWGCSLGEKTPSDDQEGVYDVGVVAPPGKTMEEAEAAGCLINYGTVLKYYPAKNRVVSWDTGQAYTFYKPDLPGYDNAYDNQMVDSFLFLE